MNLCILIPLIVGVISALLGYFLGKLFSKSNNNYKKEIDLWKSKYLKLESELNDCKGKLLNRGKSTISTSNLSIIPYNSENALNFMGYKFKENDLKVIEGIGPKVEVLFNKFGITTWHDLSKTSVSRCQEILDSEGEKFSLQVPETWPKQSQYAYEGKWKELKEWQDKLTGGV